MPSLDLSSLLRFLARDPVVHLIPEVKQIHSLPFPPESPHGLNQYESVPHSDSV